MNHHNSESDCVRLHGQLKSYQAFLNVKDSNLAVKVFSLSLLLLILVNSYHHLIFNSSLILRGTYLSPQSSIFDFLVAINTLYSKSSQTV